MAVLPVAGTPNVFDPRNPTLLPNFDKSVANGASTDHMSPAAFLAANPRVSAKATASVTGSVTTGDILTLELLNGILPNGILSKTYTTLSGDTTTNIAEQFAKLFNSDATFQAFGLEVDTVKNVLTFNHPGPVGNFSTLQAVLGEPSTITVGGTALTGDNLNVLFTGAAYGSGVLVQSSTSTGQSATTMASNLATAINANTVLTALGVSGSASGGIITMTIPAAAEPTSLSVWVNTITPTATISGTIAAADVLNITVTNAAISGGSATVSVTAITGDTTTTLATKMAAAVNASAALLAAGISATSSTTVVTFVYQAINGQLRFSQSVSPGSETITLSTTPTETITDATKASELITVGNGSTAVVAATATATIGGTESDGDTIAITFTNAGVTGFPVTVTTTAASSQSLASIASALNTLINNNMTLQAANVSSTVSGAVLTISQQGTIGNTTVLSAVVAGTGSQTETVTFAPSNGHMGGGSGVAGGVFSGGDGPIFATNNFTFGRHGVVSNFLYGNPYILGYDIIKDMVNQGLAIV